MRLRLHTGEEYEITDGENLYAVLKRHEQYVIASCGGKGTCGKCIVRVIEGDCDIRSVGHLPESRIKEGYVLACQTIPRTDIVIEIPQASRLIIGDKIAIGRARDLTGLFSALARPSSLITRLSIHLPPPTIDDSISDMERLKRVLDEFNLRLSFSKDFVAAFSEELRRHQWKVALCYEPIEGRALFVEPLVRNSPRFGLAVDIGTTTVVVNLVDLEDGRIVDVGSTYNSQIRHGDDVITRIVYATEGGGLKELRGSVVSDINNLVGIICDRHSISREHVESVSVAGNTVMSHIFWGLNPASIREEPYIPTVNRFPVWSAHDAGIRVNAQAPVYTLSCVASYVGGDIVAGVLASQMTRRSEIALFMDIGTNGEIAVGNNEWLMTAACSAGPCFEGSGIRCGMRATKGAIESIQFDASTLEPSFGVIGDIRPVGICGSGMIDAIAGMYLAGIIDQRGRFTLRDSARIREGHEGLEYVFFRDAEHDVYLSEVDIENILRAKAAIYAGVSLMIKEAGFTLDAIERVYIAGGFGNFLNVRKGIILGMLPDLPEEKFTYLGNTSIAGAYLVLMSEDLRREAEEIAAKMTYLELSVSGRFMDEYMSAMFLPHTDVSLFPSVQTLLSK